MKRFFIGLAIFVLFVVGNYVVFAPRSAQQDELIDSRTSEVISAASPDSSASSKQPKKHSNNPDQSTRLVIAVSK